MNDASPAKPRRRIAGRVAGATATAVGAALLTTPGAAVGQSDIICPDPGESPTVYTPQEAYDIALECDVEVRIDSRAFHFATVAVTPEGQFHLTATVAPSQFDARQEAFDSTLEPNADSLTPASGGWRLPYTSDAGFLLLTGGTKLSWAGTIPTPAFSGDTAVYDEIAAGLDLTTTLDAASAGLRFTVDDAEAWNVLADGLHLYNGMDPHHDGFEIVDGTVHADSSDAPYFPSERSTPFTIRDAAGVVSVAELSLAADRTLTIALPDAVADTVAYPLTLSMQWAKRSFLVNEWGSVTSASPELSVYRGEAGFDKPYFEAAGESADAIAGPYCDVLADAGCGSTQTAETFWSFQSQYLDDFFQSSEALAYPVTSATFSVDTAEGTACTAPELSRTGDYTPASTWNDRPAVTGAAGTGECQHGTAVYDVTDTVGTAWADPTIASVVTFGMTGGTETARFDGGSARLEVYFDISTLNYEAPMGTCRWNQAYPEYHQTQTPEYGTFYTSVWNPSGSDQAITWTATFADAAGTPVLTTAPTILVPGRNPAARTETALADGRYSVVYEFSSAQSRLSYRSEPCYFAIDSAAPELVSVEYDGGQHYVGDNVQVRIEVADEGFPGANQTLRVECQYLGCDWSGDSPVHTSDTTVSLTAILTGTNNRVSISVSDKAANSAAQTISIPATYSKYDFNADGHQDLVAIKKSNGNLMFYAGNGDGTFDPAVSIGPGWGRMEIVPTNMTGSQQASLLARDTVTGVLYRYWTSVDGGSLLSSKTQVATGWNAMGTFTSGGDFNGDGVEDLLAVKRSDGKLYHYAGKGDGTFAAPSAVGTGWSVMDALTSIGDVNRDGRFDLLARDGRTGIAYVYPGTGNAAFGSRIPLGTGFGETGSTRLYSQFTAVGDLNGDNFVDLVAIDSRTGQLVLHSLDERGTPLHAGRVLGTGWGASRLSTVTAPDNYDYNGDGATDFVARVGLDGTSYVYPGTGTGTHGTRVSWGTALAGMTLIATAGDLNGDGFADVLARTSGGTLYLYPGTGSGGLNTAGRINIGTGWNAMVTITGGHDYNSDGKADVIAVGTDGTLWLYSGLGDGKLGARKTVGTGWTSMKEVTATGDLDHDGHADMVAVRNADGCLYFYGGKGDGTFKPLVKIGCGWAAMDALTGVGDFNRDGHIDWLARRKSDGSLFLYPGNGAGNHAASKLVGTGWNSMTIA